MSDIVDVSIARLTQKAQLGSVLNSFRQHDGYKIFEKILQDIVEDRKQQWLQGSDEQAKIFRYQAQGVQMALGALKKVVLEGVLAQDRLKEQSETSFESPQLPS